MSSYIDFKENSSPISICEPLGPVVLDQIAVFDQDICAS